MPSQTSAALASSAAASGSIQISQAITRNYEKFKAIGTVAGGNADFYFRQWVDSGRKAQCSDAVTGSAAGVVSTDGGPYENLEVYWENNTGTITIDLEYDHPYSGSWRR